MLASAGFGRVAPFFDTEDGLPDDEGSSGGVKGWADPETPAPADNVAAGLGDAIIKWYRETVFPCRAIK